MYLFSADATISLKKIKTFLPHKKLKKPPQKVAWQLGVFFLCSPNCPKQPRTSFPFYKFFYPTISGRISDWLQLTLRFKTDLQCNLPFLHLNKWPAKWLTMSFEKIVKLQIHLLSALKYFFSRSFAVASQICFRPKP